jgi:aminopeptidase S
VAGDTATAGQWVRVDPVGTSAQPENDSADLGALCFVTGQGAVGGAAGAADVDGGVTTLLSPTMNASHPESRIVYRRWYSNNLGGAPNADSMPVSISGDGGASWVLLETVVENAGAWVERSFRVADFVAPSANVRLRFEARDLGTGSLVEAGVDFVRVVVEGCPAVPADLNGDGTVDSADLGILLAAWGLPGATDLDGSGATDSADLGILLSGWN